MPIALIVIAIALIVVGLRGTHSQLLCLLKQDLTGQSNFLYWIAAVFILGAIGYIPRVRPVSDAMLVLLIVVLVLTTRGGLFTQVQQAITTTSLPSLPAVTTSSTSTPSTPSASPSQSWAAQPGWNGLLSFVTGGLL